MFKGATIGSDVILGSLGGEAATGQFEIVAAELALIGAVIAFRHIKKNVESRHQARDDKKNAASNAAAAEQQRQADEQARQAAEQARLEQQALEQERIRAEQAAAFEAERQRVLAEEAAEQARQRQENINVNQTALNQARLNENQQDIQRAQNFVVREEDQMERQRENRINQDMSNIQPWDMGAASISGYSWGNTNTWDYMNQPIQDPADAEYEAAMAMLRGPGYDAPPNEQEQAQLDRYRQQAADRQAQNPPPPDDDPDSDDPDIGGGMPSGPGGPGRPGNPGGPGNNNNLGNGRLPERNKPKNPYADILSEIAKQIQNQKNKEKKSVDQATDEQPIKPKEKMPGEQGGGIQQQPLGQNPATWSPVSPDQPNPATQGNDYPGKNQGGIQQQNVVPIEQEKKGQAGLDNAHIAQQELEQIIAGQGNAELTSEEQLAQLTLIDQKLSTIGRQNVQLTPSSVFSGSVRRF